MNNKNVAVAMSGGIDSSIAAWILKKMKYKVTGIYMINWSKNENCYKNIIDVIKISKILNIKIKILNYEKLYKKLVLKKFFNKYKKGFTPNPDIDCNKKIKFKLLLKYVNNCLKIKNLATGHYALIKNKKNNYKLMNSKDKEKDQTYFLYKLKNKVLKKVLFPLGRIYKKEVKLIANKLNLPNKDKKESSGICFIENYKFKNFLNKYINKKFGYILNKDKKIIGIHDGFYFYTIGQRKNIKIEEKYTKFNKNYLFKKNKKKNIIYITENLKNYKLLSIGLIAVKIILNKKIKNRLYCKIKLRHCKFYISCFLRYINKKKIIIKFNKLQWGVSKGQSVVFYKGKNCLGGAIIIKSINLF